MRLSRKSCDERHGRTVMLLRCCRVHSADLPDFLDDDATLMRTERSTRSNDIVAQRSNLLILPRLLDSLEDRVELAAREGSQDGRGRVHLRDRRVLLPRSAELHGHSRHVHVEMNIATHRCA